MKIRLAGSAVALLASLALGAALLIALVAMGGRYLIMGGGEEGVHRNRLAEEKSPYLLQHADNPVDWYPWGEEAFEKARKEDKPIFLSIGYSTCHWCHVMEHESFEDADVAKLMNDTFVSIKVDREERPDIDNVYMTVAQMLTGSGGWPLTVFMTPGGEPFFAATYIPKETGPAGPGMVELIPEVARTWEEKREDVTASAHEAVAFLNKVSGIEAGDAVDSSVLDKAYESLLSSFDETYGGFGRAPKFPTPHQQVFLIRYGNRVGADRALAMVETTLGAMRRGGIYDHIGFGFHRYSTDAKWLVPHFEKMLYDQALTAMAYTEAYRATDRATYRDTAQEIFTYVLRDMTSPEGAFYSAEDADSEGGEGTFYTWTMDEVKDVLGGRDASVAFKAWGFEEDGNFEGRSIVHLPKELGEDVKGALGGIRDKLLDARGKRARPHRDDKVLASWNGLMIAALAQGAQVFDEHRYARAAERAADFILDEMRTKDGRLLHRYRDGEAAIPGMANDYAFFIWGLIELYEATFDVRYLEAAIDLNERYVARFWDKKGGGFFVTPDDGEQLIVRRKEGHDGAMPSANSVSMMNLLRLARLTGRSEWEKMADAIPRSFSRAIAKAPAAHAQLLQAIAFAKGPSLEVVVVGRKGAPDTEGMLKALRGYYSPNNVVLFRPAGEDDPAISKIAAFTKSQHMLDGKATAYVCENYSCKRPTNEISVMIDLLGEK